MIRPIQEMFNGLADKFKFIAQDKDGSIAAYTHKPYKDGDEWCVNLMVPNPDCKILEFGDSEITVGNWEDSLIKRGEE